MTTTISRPFTFVEYQSFDVRSLEESTWKPIRLPPEALQGHSIRNKWIYAFQRCDRKLELYAEFFAGGTGELSVVSGREARVLERNKRAAPVPTGASECTLPHTINGKRAFYFFVVSRIRLPADSIHGFEVATPKGVGPDLDLARDDTFVNAPRPGAMLPTESFLMVVDPITIAINMHSHYEAACDQALTFTTECSEQSPTQQRAVRDRHKSLLMAKLLKSVLDGDPADKLGLNDEFKTDRGVVTRVIDDYEHMRDALVKRKDEELLPLGTFKDGSLLSAIEESYRVFEKEDYAKWLEVLSILLSRMCESAPGKACLGKLVDKPSYAFKEYVLRTTPAPELQFEVGREAHTAIVGLWQETLPAILLKKPGSAKMVADALKNIAHIELVRIETKPVTFKYRKKNGRMRTVSKQVTEATAINPGHAIEEWAKQGVPSKTLGRLLMGIEVMNLLVGFAGLVEAEPDELGFQLLDYLGSVLDAVSAFKVLLKLKEQPARVVGALASAIDAVMAVRAGFDAYRRDDFSSMVGYGMVGVGATLSTLGFVCGIAGVAATPVPLIGIPVGALLELMAGVLIAAGWAVAVFSEDTQIEQFTSHCRWGKNFPSDSTVEQKGNWVSGRSFSAWSDPDAGLDHQLMSLFALLGAFTVDAIDYTGIRVQLGLVMADTRLRLKVHSRYLIGSNHEPKILRKHEPEVVVDLAARTMTHVGGDPQDPKKFSVGESNGRPFVEFRAAWPPGEGPELPSLDSCDVEVQLLLDEKGTTVPLQGTLAYHVYTFGVGLGGALSSHG